MGTRLASQYFVFILIILDREGLSGFTLVFSSLSAARNPSPHTKTTSVITTSLLIKSFSLDWYCYFRKPVKLVMKSWLPRLVGGEKRESCWLLINQQSEIRDFKQINLKTGQTQNCSLSGRELNVYRVKTSIIQNMPSLFRPQARGEPSFSLHYKGIFGFICFIESSYVLCL